MVRACAKNCNVAVKALSQEQQQRKVKFSHPPMPNIEVEDYACSPLSSQVTLLDVIGAGPGFGG